MDPASASLRVIRALSKADDVPRGVIRAYHGSPYSFSRFDASKIGTGEGAQSYGHGLYFAGAEDTARTYRNILSGRRDVLIDGRSVGDALKDFEGGGQLGWSSTESPVRSPQANALRALMAGAYDADSVDAVLANARRYAADAPAARAAQNLTALQDLASRDIRLGAQPGHMYEVELGVPEESLLDWDAPISDQTNVRQRLGSLGDVALRDRLTGRNVYELMQAQHGNDRNASSVLTEFGIPGIQYFDAGSRSQQQGTRNYVMFPGTEDRISILRQYGLLPPLVGAAAMEEE